MSFYTQNSVLTLAHQLCGRAKAFLKKTLSSPHKKAAAGFASFNSAFSDTGHWDFAVLLAFENLFRGFVIASSSVITEFSIVEKGGSLARRASLALGDQALPSSPSNLRAVGSALLSGLFYLISASALASLSIYL